MSYTLKKQALQSTAFPEQKLTAFVARLFIILSLVVWGASFFLDFENCVILLMFIGLSAAALGYFLPPIGLIGIGFLCTLDAIAQSLVLTGGLLRYNTVNYMLVGIMLISIPLLLKFHDLSTRLLEIFLILLGLELILSPNISQGIQDMLNIVSMFGLVVYLTRAINDEDAYFWMGIVNGVLAGAGTAVIYLQFEQLPYLNPNVWTFFPMTALFSLCIAFPFALKRKNGTLWILVLSTINFIWIFLSGSRGNLLISMCCLLYLFFSAKKGSLRITMIILGLVGVLGMAAFFLEEQSYTVERILLTFDSSQSVESRTSHRSVIAKAGWILFTENPMGVGTGGFSQAVATVDLLAGSKRPAHAAWVKVLAENGFLGAILLFLFVISFTIVGWIKRKQPGLLVMGLFVSASFGVAFISKEYQGKSMWLLGAAAIVFMHKDTVKGFLTPQKTLTASKRFSRKLKAKQGKAV